MKLAFDKNLWKVPDNKYLVALLPRLRERRIRTFTTLALTLLTFTIFSVFAISPTLGTITDLQKQISDSEFVNQQLQTKITNLSVLQDNYTRLKPQLPAVYAGIPITAEIAIFLGQLQSIAINSQVTILRVQTLPVDFSSGTLSTKYSSYSFAIDVSGSQNDIVTFLHNLTSFSRLVSLDALSFGKTTRLADVYTLSIRGSTYFQTQ